MEKSLANIKLRERVKELKCLYELSRSAENDLATVINKTLKILPAAMQFPKLAEVKIILDKQIFSTDNYKDTKLSITVPLTVDKKKRGSIEVIYHKNSSLNLSHPFLPEEKKLLTAVAQELSHIVKRVGVEKDKQTLKLQLQHAERLAFVGELTAGIAHELNEPLGRILGFAQLIRKSGDMNEQQNVDMERIIKASLYTREIIKKLMIFSRQMPQQIISVNLNEIVSNILYFIDVRYQSQKIQIQQKLSPHLPIIYADPVQISQVVVNLVTNGIHAMPAGGELTISTSRLKNNVKLIVKDSGHGMNSETKKKIFQPFFTTKPIGQGTGLGLSVVQGIVTSHNGKINVQSSLGQGSKFEIILPIKQ